MHIIDNPFNVLTNNPPFLFHKHNICNYMQLHNDDPFNNLNKTIDLKPYSYGLGAFNLPGDFSSSSRFVRAFFNKSKVVFPEDNKERIITYFKLLDSVSIIKGCVKTSNGYHYSRYASCFSYNDKSFYYKTYYSNEIVKINMFNKDLSQNELMAIELRGKVEFTEENN
jgi:choloylglycine hydrolase